MALYLAPSYSTISEVVVRLPATSAEHPAPGAGTYVQSRAASFTSSAGTTGIRIDLECLSEIDFIVRFDDVFLGVNLTPVELQEFSVE